MADDLRNIRVVAIFIMTTLLSAKVLSACAGNKYSDNTASTIIAGKGYKVIGPEENAKRRQRLAVIMNLIMLDRCNNKYFDDETFWIKGKSRIRMNLEKSGVSDAAGVVEELAGNVQDSLARADLEKRDMGPFPKKMCEELRENINRDLSQR